MVGKQSQTLLAQVVEHLLEPLNTSVCHLLPRIIQRTALTWADIARNASHSLPLMFSQGQPVTDLKIKLLPGL